MATRRRASRRSLTGTITDIQQRVQYLQNRATPTRLANEVVRRTNIQPRAVASDQIALDAVTNDQVAADAIANEQLQEDSVDTPQLRNASVEEVKMADNSITNRAMTDNSVSTGNIQDDAVNNAKLDANSVDTRQLVDDAVTNAKIDDGAVRENSIANDAVKNRHIDSNAVEDTQIANDAVKNRHIDSGAVDTDEIANGAVDTNQIASGAVTSAKIGSGEVKQTNIDGGAVGTSQLATGAVDTNQLASNAVTAAKIAANAVGSSEIASGAVNTSEIANGAVTDAKIDGMDGRKLESESVFSTKMSAATKDTIVSQGLEVGFGINKRGNTISVASRTFASDDHIHEIFLPGRDSLGGRLSEFILEPTTGPRTSSSRKFKKDISNHKSEDPKKLLELDLKKYKYRRNFKPLQATANREWMHGYILEDLLDLGFEEAATYNSEGAPDKIDYGVFSALVLELVKVQQQEIDYLKDKIDKLERKQ